MRKNTRLFLITLAFICSTLFNLKAQTTLISGLTDGYFSVINGTDLYVSDISNGKILKIDLLTNTQTDFLTGLRTPVGLAIKGDDLYFSKFRENSIYKINLTSKQQTFITGLNDPGASSVPEPYGLAFHGDELYIGDLANGKIFKINVTGAVNQREVLTGLLQPYGLAFKGDELYFAEFTGNNISKTNVTGTLPLTATTVISVPGPSGIVFDGDYLYIAERNQGKVSRIDVTANPIVAKDVVTGLSKPVGVSVYNGNLYITEKPKVSKIPLPCLKPKVTKVGGFTLSAPTVAGVTYRWLDCGRNNIPIANATSPIYQATATGSYAVESTWGSIGCKDTSVCTAVTDLTLLRSLANSIYYSAVKGNDLYASDTSSGKIYKIDLLTSLVTEFATGLQNPSGLTIKDNDLYVAEYSSNKIIKINLSSKVKTDIVTGLTNPLTIAIKGDELYLVEARKNKVSSVTIAGTPPFTTLGDVVTGLDNPVGLAIKDNELYIGEGNATGKISKIDLTAALPLTSSTSVVTVADPYGVVFDGNDLYFIEKSAGKVSRINIAASPIVKTEVFTGLQDANSLVVYANDLYILDNIGTGSEIIKIPLPCPDKPTVTRTGVRLITTVVTDARYRWLDCDNGYAEVPNVNTNLYIANATGSYAVELTKNSCKDTSIACAAVTVCVTKPSVTKRGKTLSTTAVTGATYQWIDCETAIAVPGETTNSFTPTVSGNYAVELTESSGCLAPSICTLVCIADKPTVTKTGTTLSTTALEGATYSWLDCSNSNMPVVPNATAESYTPTTSGNYSLELTSAIGCIDTSLCTVVCGVKPAVTKAGNTLTTPMLRGVTYRWLDCGNNNMPLATSTTNSYTATASGNYAVETTRSAVCVDTSICTVVCVATKPIITKVGHYTLTIPAANGASYRWLNCDNNNRAVASATTNSYTATTTGNYAVEFTSIGGGCIDTSLCMAVCAKQPAVTKAGGFILSVPAVNGVTYQWLDCDDNNKAVPNATNNLYKAKTSTGNYAVELTWSSEGCKDTSLCIATDLVLASVDVNPSYFARKGNDLYVSDKTNKIYKIDLLTNSKTQIKGSEVINPNGLAILGNDLYVAVTPQNKVIKIDLSSRAETDVVTGIGGSVLFAGRGPQGLAFKGNDLYISGAVDKILKVDVTATLPIAATQATTLLTGLSYPYNIAFKGNDLYITEYGGSGKISKIDVTAASPTKTVLVTGIAYSRGIAFDGNDLYISSSDKILRTDITASPIVKTEVFTGLNSPLGMLVYDDELYVAENGPDVDQGRVSKFIIPCYKPTVAKAGINLTTSVVNGATYRWLDCGNGYAEVPNAITNSYTATTNGSYAVEVTRNSRGCKDTSVCVTIGSIPIAEGFTNLYDGIVKGSDLYVSDYKFAASEIFKINLSVNPATKTSFKSGLSHSRGLAILGNDIYFIDYARGKVSKINISSKQQTDVINGLEVTGTYDMAFKGNELYISKTGKVVKADVTGTLPINSTTDVITGLGRAEGIVFKGDVLYFSEVISGKILKKDVTTTGTTATEVFSGLTHPYGIVFDGNYLYISEESVGKISRINLEANPIVAKEVATGLSNPNGLLIYSDTLYVMEDTVVSKISLPCPDKPIVTRVGEGVNLTTSVLTRTTYRWLDCGNNNAPITNATTNSYTPAIPGTYSVEVTRSNSCVDTSACVTIASIPIATGFTNLYDGAIKGSDLYVSDYNTTLSTASEIFKIDLSVNPATKTSFKAGINSPSGVAILGNDVYFVNYAEGKVSKINISSKQQTDVVNGLKITNTYNIAFKGNELYISMADSVVKVDVTGTLPITSPTAVVTALNQARGIAFKGDELYLSDVASGKILKKDVTTTGTTATEVISGLTGGSTGLAFDGNYLYVSEEVSGKILRINLEANPIVAKEVATGLSKPTGQVIYGDTLYIMEDTIVSKIPLPCPDKPIVTKVGATLTTSLLTRATYRWLNCGTNNTPILNATTNSYTATVSGNYAVEVTRDGCKDTSICSVACSANKPLITKKGFALITPNEVGKTYRWLDCGNNNAPITNATTNLYTSLNPGNYAVEVTLGSNCKDTSICVVTAGLCLRNIPAVTLTGNTLKTTENGVTYRWLNCNGNIPVSGQTGGSYTPDTSGSYSVEVRRVTGCRDTSICTKICLPDNTIIDKQAACGNSYVWSADGKTYTANTTTAKKTLTNRFGCDSTVTLHLSIGSPITLSLATADLPNSNTRKRNYTPGTGNSNYIKNTSGWLTSSIPQPFSDFLTFFGVGPKIAAAIANNPDNVGIKFFVMDRNIFRDQFDSTAVLNLSSLTTDKTFLMRKDANNVYNFKILFDKTAKTITISSTFGTDANPSLYPPNSYGAIYGIKLSGTVALSTSFVDRQVVCGNSYTWPVDGNVYTVNTNTPSKVFSGNNMFGCDSTVTLDLTFINDKQITRNGNTLLSAEADPTVTYQWLNCATTPASVITSVTSPSYTPTADGNYAVEITKGTCIDTTSCLNFTLCPSLPNPFVSRTSTTLTATETGAMYQWIDCSNNNMPVANATAQSFTPTKSGSYAVEITKNGCKVTSICLVVCVANKPTVTVTGTTLTTPAIGTYKWLACGTGTTPVSPLNNAENQSYTPTLLNNNFAVEVTREANCKDTSVCILVCAPDTTIDKQIFCGSSYVWKVDGKTYTANTTTANKVFTNRFGCDSVVVLHLALGSTTTLSEANTEIPNISSRKKHNTPGTDLTKVSLQGSSGWLTSSIPQPFEEFLTFFGVDPKIAAAIATNPDNVSIEFYGMDRRRNGRYGVSKKLALSSLSVAKTFTMNVSSSNDSYQYEVLFDKATKTIVVKSTHGTTTDPYKYGTNAYGAIYGIILSGTAGLSTSFIDKQEACGNSYTWPVDGNVYTAATNTPTKVITGGNMFGCDSTVTLNLNFIDNGITRNGNTLTVAQEAAGITYRWLDCANTPPTPISPSATAQSYTPTANGNYAVEITNGTTCKDTSSCINIVLCTAVPDASVTKTGTTLMATETGANYKWLDCNNNNAPIANATAQSYVPTVTGNYAVEITKGGCTVTSTCTAVCIAEKPIVTKVNTTLTAPIVGITAYKWLNCNRNTPLAGQTTSLDYKATESGSYAVEVTRANACVDTSLCTLVCFPDTVIDNQTTCATSYLWTDGKTYTANTTTAKKVFTNRFGCDSLVILNLSLGSPMTLSSTTADFPNVNSKKKNNTPGTGALVYIGSASGWLTSPNSQPLTDFLAFFGVDPKLAAAIATNPDKVGIKFYLKDRRYPSYYLRRILINRYDSTEVVNLSSLSTLTPFLINKSATYNFDILFDKATKRITIKSIHGIFINPDEYGTNAYGAVYGIKLYGTVSLATSFTDKQVVCGDSYTWPVDGNTYTASTNTPKKVIAGGNMFGCDSTITLDLTFAIDKRVTRNGNTLTAAEKGAGVTYRWLRKGLQGANPTPIATGLSQSYTPQRSGYYAAEITKGTCTDTTIFINVATLCTSLPNASVTKTGNTLMATETGATYKWLDCNNNNMPIASATAQTYTPTVTGNYAVEITKNSCTVTSTCTVVCFPTKPTVTKAGNRLTVDKIGTYRWLDCNSNYLSVGKQAKNKSYIPFGDGNYAVEVTNSSGCKDTSNCTNIVFCSVLPNVSIEKFGGTLTVAEMGATYQWLDCNNNNTPIANATDRVYVPAVIGNYAVKVTKNGCVATSACVTVNKVGLIENTFASNVKLYPNPTTRDITVELGDSYTDLKIEVVNILGQVIVTKQVNSTTNKVVLPIEASSGIYFVRLQAREGFASFRIVKE